MTNNILLFSRMGADASTIRQKNIDKALDAATGCRVMIIPLESPKELIKNDKIDGTWVAEKKYALRLYFCDHRVIETENGTNIGITDYELLKKAKEIAMMNGPKEHSTFCAFNLFKEDKAV